VTVFSLQATKEVCSPVQVMQLLQPDSYPDNDAADLFAQACSRVLIYSKTLSRVRIDLAARRSAFSPSYILRRIGTACFRFLRESRMSIPSRIMLVLVLLTVVALFKLRRGIFLRVVQLLLRYRRR
jgi:hypothetical protein